MAVIDHLVTSNWLAANLDREDVKVLDGTWIMPNTVPELPVGFIPTAQYFDIDKVASQHPMLKHMLPDAVQFEAAMGEMSIHVTDHVICYDRFGVRSSPRLWWTFREFGHEKVSILDGGLPDWIYSGYNVSQSPSKPTAKSGYKSKASNISVISKNEILETLQNNPQIVDARSLGRFLGTESEPRKHLRSGRIPGSCSFPYMEQLRNGKLKPLSELAKAVSVAKIDLNKPIVTSCGSGVTAAGLAFIFTLLGAKDIRVYDGSWSEWGASDAPIEVGHG
ncbi:MAG: sulfurtransferase [Hellea sp.]|nr:sulfurtransferase [Hellea sp.]